MITKENVQILNQYTRNSIELEYPIFFEDHKVIKKLLRQISKAVHLHVEGLHPDLKICWVSRGTSGSFIMGLLTTIEKNPDFMLIPKDDENSHRGKDISCSFRDSVCKNYYYVFIDDFISTGRTLIECAYKLNKKNGMYIDACATIFRNEGYFDPTKILNDLIQDVDTLSHLRKYIIGISKKPLVWKEEFRSIPEIEELFN